MELPSCLDCKYSDQGYPCRKADGTFDFAKVARAYVLHGRTFGEEGGEFDAEARQEHAWAGDCAFELEQDYPELLLSFVVAAIDACETLQDAAFVSAGPLENAVTNHGPALIGKIESLAEKSAKFRYMLSAIWGERRADPAVWARVVAAVGSSGRMDSDGRTPSDGKPVNVLDEMEALELLKKERVSDAAKKVHIPGF